MPINGLMSLKRIGLRSRMHPLKALLKSTVITLPDVVTRFRPAQKPVEGLNLRRDTA